MKVNFVHICEKAFFTEEKKLCIIGIFNGISVKTFPGFHSGFSIVLNFSGKIEGETKIVIESPSGDELFVAPLNTEMNETDMPSSAVVVNIIGFKIPEEGNYKVLLKSKGEIVSPEREDILIVDKD